MWQFEGVSKRLPLPCCVYNIIRSTFPSQDGMYRGFEEEDEEEDEEVDEGEDSENEDEEDDLGEQW